MRVISHFISYIIRHLWFRNRNQLDPCPSDISCSVRLWPQKVAIGAVDPLAECSLVEALPGQFQSQRKRKCGQRASPVISYRADYHELLNDDTKECCSAALGVVIPPTKYLVYCLLARLWQLLREEMCHQALPFTVWYSANQKANNNITFISSSWHPSQDSFHVSRRRNVCILFRFALPPAQIARCDHVSYPSSVTLFTK